MEVTKLVYFWLMKGLWSYIKSHQHKIWSKYGSFTVLCMASWFTLNFYIGCWIMKSSAQSQCSCFLMSFFSCISSRNNYMTSLNISRKKPSDLVYKMSPPVVLATTCFREGWAFWQQRQLTGNHGNQSAFIISARRLWQFGCFLSLTICFL